MLFEVLFEQVFEVSGVSTNGMKDVVSAVSDSFVGSLVVMCDQMGFPAI